MRNFFGGSIITNCQGKAPKSGHNANHEVYNVEEHETVTFGPGPNGAKEANNYIAQDPENRKPVGWFSRILGR